MKKLWYSINFRMATCYMTIVRAFIKWFWHSKRGAAMFHAIFDFYTSTPMYEERKKVFGAVEAVKMFSYSEFKMFERKLIKDDWFYTRLLFAPSSIISELGEKDMYLKRLVNLK